MISIRGNTHPSVGVKLMDRDHDCLSEILGEIQFRVAAGLGGAKTGEMVRQLAHHMQLHFALEEGMMEASRFPGIAIHQLQHKLLIDQVHALATQRGSSALRRNAEPLNFLAASHIKHIGYADLHYGIWLNASSSQRTDTACTNKIDI
jgi:hemerythrin